MKFVVRISNNGLGMNFAGPVAKAKFQEWAKQNRGRKIILTPIIPESKKMRGFFEGGIISLLTYYQENLDHNNPDHREMVREWVLGEFNAGMVNIAGKARRVPLTSKGKLYEIIEKVIEWMEEQGYNTNLLNPEDYKYWRDAVYSIGGPASYIDYLITIKKLPQK